MVSLSYSTNSAAGAMRPVNIRTDLAALADLIEIVFADSMDSSGRAAVSEMRALSRFGAGLPFLANLDEMTMGLSLGFVWVVDGRIVGNVSVYPANWPAELGSGWLIANVGTHPDFRGRGIARRLMEAALDMIRRRGGDCAVLQVDTENLTARRVYERLGFYYERGWTAWRRTTSARVPAPLRTYDVYITRRQDSEWQAEYALAQLVRPAARGGLGWQRPLHPKYFRPSILRSIGHWLTLRTHERLIIRDPHDTRRLLAALWLENSFGAASPQLTLLVHPDYQGLYDDALLNAALRRFAATPLLLEHPADDTAVLPVLEHYRFVARKHYMVMRWNAR